MLKIIHWYPYSAKRKCKQSFEKDFFELMNNANLEKTIENVRKHRDIKLLSNEARRSYFVILKIYLHYEWKKKKKDVSGINLNIYI